MGPLRETASELGAQRDALQHELELLQSELERWQARCTQLIEQCNRNDPEQLKKALYAHSFRFSTSCYRLMAVLGEGGPR